MAGRETLAGAVFLVVFSLLIPPLGRSEGPPTVMAVVGEYDRMARAPLWPNFDPARIPLLIYDGETTYLVRHPRPPEEFRAFGERADILRFAGRHAAARSNSSVDVGGVKTASAILGGGSKARPRDVAALMMHEAFHAFQGERHPGWAANEVDFFVYPLEEAELLLLQRMESAALRLALLHKGGKLGACWTRRALQQRKERFTKLGPPSAAYERGTELNEGLAQYVEYEALRRPHVDAWPASDFAPQEVRQRGYASGQAMAALLDIFHPEWKEELENGSKASLDELLSSKVPAAPESCQLPAPLEAAMRAAAQADVETLRSRNRERREAFLSRTGWRLVVVPAAGAPLFPQAFDPWNVRRLQPGEVLHGRWVKLGNASGEIEVLDREALTEAAGAHPLFEGVRRLRVSGLEREPVIEQENEFVVVRAPGVNARFRDAVVSNKEGTVEINLTKPQEGGKP